MGKRIHRKLPAAIREHYPFRPDWTTEPLHGYQVAGDTERRTAWVLLDMNQTVLDDTGCWFDGPLLTGQQALELADLVDSWPRRVKATPDELAGRPTLHARHRVQVVAGELVVVGVSRLASTLSLDSETMRSIPTMSPRQVRALARQLRAAGRQIVKAEEEREAAL
jgi:hypothetical protein